MSLVLGIDQGASATRAVLCDLEGHLLAYGQANGACHAFDGMDRAMAAVQQAASAALVQAEVAPGQITCVFGGFTGADWPDEYGLLEGAVRHTGLCERVYITNDSIVALRGGTDQPYGAILIAGSGGNCAIRSPDGREFIYHYYHDNDLQGGSALGFRLLKAVFRSATFREPPTSLTQRVLELTQLQTVDDLMRAVVEGRVPNDSVKDFAPLVFEAAYAGDQVAAGILQRFGEGYAELAAAGLKHFDMVNLEVEVVLSGSIFKGVGSLLAETIAANLHRSVPRARLMNARYEPVVGAALLGLEKQSLRITEAVKENIERTAQVLGLIRIDPNQ